MTKIDLINAILGRMKERYAGYAWDIVASDEVLGETLIEIQHEMNGMVADWHRGDLKLTTLGLSSEKVSESPPQPKSKIDEMRRNGLWQEFVDAIEDNAVSTWASHVIRYQDGVYIQQWDFDEGEVFGDEIGITRNFMIDALEDIASAKMAVESEYRAQAWSCLHDPENTRQDIDGELASLICQWAMFGHQEFAV